MLSMSLKIGIPEEALKQGAGPDILRALHEHSRELADFEETNVRGRTPKRTGALREAVSATAHASTSNPSLATLYYAQGPQLETWGRYYAVYQEGPPMGLQTYTNEPRQMLNNVYSQDGGQIEDWAARVGQTALDEWVAGLNA